nr:Fe-S cluster protein [Aeromicrobium sp.]
STFWQAYFVEAVIFGVVLCGFLLRTLEYALEKEEHGSGGLVAHYPLTFFLGNAWGGLSLSSLETLVYVIAMIKIVISMTWLIVIARNITMGVAWHRFTAWFNIWFKRESDGSTALGALKPLYVNGEPLDLEKMDDLEEEDFALLGVGKVEDFTWKGLLDFTTCTECGRCQSQCPAWNTEKPLSPKLLMMGLRDHAYAKIPLLDKDAETLTEAQQAELERPLIGDESMFGVIDPDVLWSCTNCGACVQQCPVDIEHVDHILDMRRYQVIVESNFPSELNNIFKGLERKGNPWNMDNKVRMDWAKNLDFEVKQLGTDIEDLDEVEWLFWVGCAGAFEDRAKKTTAAVAELLNTAGVSFAVLGDGETCTGDAARRAGNEILFKQLGMQNAEVLTEMKAKKVVSTCAHCFNTLKNEYKEFGLDLEVVHHTQLLNRLVREKKLTPVAPASGSAAGKTITYHDPCFLGRHNQVYEPPRELLGAIPGATFKEMPRNSEKSFCCGAGGARMWMEETIGSRINVNRTEEAIATGADQIAVGCPFCRVMLSDGLTLKQSEGKAREEVEVLDVAQLLLAGVKRAPEPTKDDDDAVVAEAEAATAAAATGGDGPSDDDVAKATEAEPDAEDKADPDSISETEEVGAGAKAHQDGDPGDKDPATGSGDAEDVADALQEPSEKSAEADQDIAADSNVKLDERGGGHADESAAPTEPRNADARDVQTSDAATTEQPAAAAADEEAPAEVNDDPASEKEDAAWANVGAVNTDLTPSEPEPAKAEPTKEEPAPAPAPTEETEPVEDDAREEEADTVTDDAEPSAPTSKVVAPDEVIAVEDGETTADPVSEDVVELSDANPSGKDLSQTATQLSLDLGGNDDEDKPKA